MSHAEFLEAVRSRAARSAATASAVRGRGNTGTVDASRAYLRHMDLTPFGSPSGFAAALDQETARLLAKLPIGAQHWGMARKVLNIFLRDCLYTTFLEKEFHLSRADAAFELPLDSITVTHLKRAAGRGLLPPWPGVRHLSKQNSDLFQKAAAEEANRRGLTRVHLDAVWWAQGRDGETT